MSALTMENNNWVVFVLMPVSRWQKFLMLLMLLTSCSAQSTYYVTSTPDTPCPGEPCHTLSQYVADQYFKNLPTKTAIEFLPGNHTLEEIIFVKTLTWLTLHGDSSSLPEITTRIVCTWPAGFVFTGITELHIRSLAFISCGHNYSAAVNIISVQWSNILNSSFYNNVNTDRYECNYYDYSCGQYYGSALNIQVSNVILTGNVFQNNSAEYGGVLHIKDSILTITDNTFQNNSAGYLGGVLYVEDSTLTVTANIFLNNSAGYLGGVLYVEDSTLVFTDNTFQNNTATADGGVLCVEDSNLTVTESMFQSNSAEAGGVLYVRASTLTFINSTFQNNMADAAGVLFVRKSNLTITDNTFHNNSGNGGVSHAWDSIVITIGGGVLYATESTLTVTDNTFQNNSAESGGVLYLEDSTLIFTDNTFQNNTANAGGVLYVWDSKVTAIGNTFQKNTADVGGVLSIECSTVNLIGNTFQNNVGTELGGAIFAYNNSNCNHESIVRIYGNNVIEHNRARYGGGITALNRQFELGNITIKNCTASYGGGLYVHNTEITGNMTLTNNLALEGGGGMYVSSSTINFIGNSIIMNNLVNDGNGGGLLLSGESEFYLQPNTHVNFIGNRAKNTGGAIKVEERNPLTYCIDSTNGLSSNSDCFFQMQTFDMYQYYYNEIKKFTEDLKIGIYFDNNSAEAGADLHGGSVDDCTFSNIETFSRECFVCPTSGNVFDDIIISEKTPDISSDPLYICTCKDNQTNCTGSYHPEPVYPGGTLEVPVIARGQRNGTTPAVIQIISTLNSNITIQENENIQNAKRICTAIKYTIQSFNENTIQNMTLHAQGPCPPTLANTLKILVRILSCPSGFQLSDTQPICICTKRLQQFTNSCQVDSRTIHRTQNAQFWVGYDNKSDSIILHPHCPFDYCTLEETHLAVDDSDKQCKYNRSGLLCGRCSDNLSLTFGSSRCLQCSNSYLSLLIAFAFAGIALVVLLLVLRLTVAAGTINGLIFYANVVAVNSAIFFQPQINNVPTILLVKVLTMFVAWLNLDLGIEACFYNGMDAYVKTWLQLAFPLYVWALVGMIIIGSHYSGRMGKVLGSNPIAVLATLFLLSYAKLLRTVIAALSYTFLEYPNNSHIAVWLYDGNIRYLGGKHILLFTFAMVSLIFLFFPYMMLLTFGQWLQAKSNFKIISWINSPKMKPILDAYHAPYTNKHRYWTGLMLLLRFILFLISAVNTLGDPSDNLLAIAFITVAILTLHIISGTRIYKTWSLGLLETSFILNLTILAVASFYIRLTGGNQSAATFTSVSIAFTTFTGIVIYHSIQQIKGTTLWKRVSLKHEYPLNDVASRPEDSPDSVSSSVPTQTVIDSCYYELREPCMATD